MWLFAFVSRIWLPGSGLSSFAGVPWLIGVFGSPFLLPPIFVDGGSNSPHIAPDILRFFYNIGVHWFIFLSSIHPKGGLDHFPTFSRWFVSTFTSNRRFLEVGGNNRSFHLLAGNSYLAPSVRLAFREKLAFLNSIFTPDMNSK